ncbi:hypothetical protein H9P43_000882 [Blastocladiella emersonii ATCC 22665]|nr:hypothetical protein H9P43_000882 [Blastocladiella emersonii ATCC 22665]
MDQPNLAQLYQQQQQRLFEARQQQLQQQQQIQLQQLQQHQGSMNQQQQPQQQQQPAFIVPQQQQQQQQQQQMQAQHLQQLQQLQQAQQMQQLQQFQQFQQFQLQQQQNQNQNQSHQGQIAPQLQQQQGPGLVQPIRAAQSQLPLQQPAGLGAAAVGGAPVSMAMASGAPFAAVMGTPAMQGFQQSQPQMQPPQQQPQQPAVGPGPGTAGVFAPTANTTPVMTPAQLAINTASPVSVTVPAVVEPAVPAETPGTSPASATPAPGSDPSTPAPDASSSTTPAAAAAAATSGSKKARTGSHTGGVSAAQAAERELMASDPFYADLIPLLRKNNVTFRSSNMCGVPLNHKALWDAVQALGGWDQLNSSKHWREIGNSLGYPTSNSNIPSFLKRHYLTMLLPLEELRGIRPPGAVGSTAHHGAAGASDDADAGGAAAGANGDDGGDKAKATAKPRDRSKKGKAARERSVRIKEEKGKGAAADHDAPTASPHLAASADHRERSMSLSHPSAAALQQPIQLAMDGNIAVGAPPPAAAMFPAAGFAAGAPLARSSPASFPGNAAQHQQLARPSYPGEMGKGGALNRVTSTSSNGRPLSRSTSEHALSQALQPLIPDGFKLLGEDAAEPAVEYPDTVYEYKRFTPRVYARDSTLAGGVDLTAIDNYLRVLHGGLDRSIIERWRHAVTRTPQIMPTLERDIHVLDLGILQCQLASRLTHEMTAALNMLLVMSVNEAVNLPLRECTSLVRTLCGVIARDLDALEKVLESPDVADRGDAAAVAASKCAVPNRDEDVEDDVLLELLAPHEPERAAAMAPGYTALLLERVHTATLILRNWSFQNDAIPTLGSQRRVHQAVHRVTGVFLRIARTVADPHHPFLTPLRPAGAAAWVSPLLRTQPVLDTTANVLHHMLVILSNTSMYLDFAQVDPAEVEPMLAAVGDLCTFFIGWHHHWRPRITAAVADHLGPADDANADYLAMAVLTNTMVRTEFQPTWLALMSPPSVGDKSAPAAAAVDDRRLVWLLLLSRVITMIGADDAAGLTVGSIAPDVAYLDMGMILLRHLLRIEQFVAAALGAWEDGYRGWIAASSSAAVAEPISPLSPTGIQVKSEPPRHPLKRSHADMDASGTPFSPKSTFPRPPVPSDLAPPPPPPLPHVVSPVNQLVFTLLRSLERNPVAMARKAAELLSEVLPAILAYQSTGTRRARSGSISGGSGGAGAAKRRRTMIGDGGGKAVPAPLSPLSPPPPPLLRSAEERVRDLYERHRDRWAELGLPFARAPETAVAAWSSSSAQQHAPPLVYWRAAYERLTGLAVRTDLDVFVREYSYRAFVMLGEAGVA